MFNLLLSATAGCTLAFVIALIVTLPAHLEKRERKTQTEYWDDGHPKSKPQYTEPDPPNPLNPMAGQVWSPGNSQTSIADQYFDTRTEDDCA